jgi:hypothetical protein
MSIVGEMYEMLQYIFFRLVGILLVLISATIRPDGT